MESGFVNRFHLFSMKHNEKGNIFLWGNKKSDENVQDLKKAIKINLINKSVRQESVRQSVRQIEQR